MNYVNTIKQAHDLVCTARNLLDEMSSTMSCDTDVHVNTDLVIDDLVARLEEVEDALFSGCNIADINELADVVAL